MTSRVYVIQNAIENAELMLEDSGKKKDIILDEGSDDGNGYELGYHQGRKDACRILLIGLREAH